MLTTWLIELFLNELGSLKDEGDGTTHSKLQRDFHKFLESDALRLRIDIPTTNTTMCTV